MHDSNQMGPDWKEWRSQEADLVSHPAVIVREVVPNNVRCDTHRERQEYAERCASGMGKKRLKNFAVSLREHLQGWSAQEIKRRENEQAGRDTEEKSLDWMVSKWAEIETAKEIARVRTDATGDEGWEAQVAGTEPFEWQNGCGVS